MKQNGPQSSETEQETLQSDLEKVLVFSSGGDIFVLYRDNSIVKVASREDWVLALYSHPRKHFVDAGC